MPSSPGLGCSAGSKDSALLDALAPLLLAGLRPSAADPVETAEQDAGLEAPSSSSSSPSSSAATPEEQHREVSVIVSVSSASSAALAELPAWTGLMTCEPSPMPGPSKSKARSTSAAKSSTSAAAMLLLLSREAISAGSPSGSEAFAAPSCGHMASRGDSFGCGSRAGSGSSGKLEGCDRLDLFTSRDSSAPSSFSSMALATPEASKISCCTELSASSSGCGWPTDVRAEVGSLTSEEAAEVLLERETSAAVASALHGMASAAPSRRGMRGAAHFGFSGQMMGKMALKVLPVMRIVRWLLRNSSRGNGQSSSSVRLSPPGLSGSLLWLLMLLGELTKFCSRKYCHTRFATSHARRSSRCVLRITSLYLRAKRSLSRGVSARAPLLEVLDKSADIAEACDRRFFTEPRAPASPPTRASQREHIRATFDDGGSAGPFFGTGSFSLPSSPALSGSPAPAPAPALLRARRGDRLNGDMFRLVMLVVAESESSKSV
mmetsp:Transcript_140361/g.349923  ORF Transcript_140361/g.349923 Transcript_140361/m.349923 type:complete len:491 (+) Transcript_140361:547-2019(+)